MKAKKGTQSTDLGFWIAFCIGSYFAWHGLLWIIHLL